MHQHRCGLSPPPPPSAHVAWPQRAAWHVHSRHANRTVAQSAAPPMQPQGHPRARQRRSSRRRTGRASGARIALGASRTRRPHRSCEQPRARIIPQALQVWHCELHTSCAGRPGWACRTGSPRCRVRGRDPAGVSVRLVLLAVLRAFEPAGAFPRVCRSIRPVPAPGAEMGQSQVYRTGMTCHALVGWLAVHSAGKDDGWALSVSDGPAPPDKGRAAHLHLNVSLHATQHACALATPAVHIRLSGQMRVPEHLRKKKTWESAVEGPR